jgi:hypothetical protein
VIKLIIALYLLFMAALLGFQIWLYMEMDRQGIKYTQTCNTTFTFGPNGTMIPVVYCVPVILDGEKK